MLRERARLRAAVTEIAKTERTKYRYSEGFLVACARAVETAGSNALKLLAFKNVQAGTLFLAEAFGGDSLSILGAMSARNPGELAASVSSQCSVLLPDIVAGFRTAGLELAVADSFHAKELSGWGENLSGILLKFNTDHLDGWLREGCTRGR